MHACTAKAVHGGNDTLVECIIIRAGTKVGFNLRTFADKNLRRFKPYLNIASCLLVRQARFPISAEIQLQKKKKKFTVMNVCTSLLVINITSGKLLRLHTY